MCFVYVVAASSASADTQRRLGPPLRPQASEGLGAHGGLAAALQMCYICQCDRLLWNTVQQSCRLVAQQFGFPARHQSMNISEALRGILQDYEWGHIVFIASLDLDTAFGQLEGFAVETNLLEHDAPARAIAQVMREVLGQRAGPTLTGVSCDNRVVLGKSPRQSGRGPPTM